MEKKFVINTSWPRIRDLPKQEQGPFRQWLTGQTCPVIEGEPDSEQDGYYQHDYDKWKGQQMAIKKLEVVEFEAGEDFTVEVEPSEEDKPQKKKGKEKRRTRPL